MGKVSQGRVPLPDSYVSSPSISPTTPPSQTPSSFHVPPLKRKRPLAHPLIEYTQSYRPNNAELQRGQQLKSEMERKKRQRSASNNMPTYPYSRDEVNNSSHSDSHKLHTFEPPLSPRLSDNAGPLELPQDFKVDNTSVAIEPEELMRPEWEFFRTRVFHNHMQARPTGLQDPNNKDSFLRGLIVLAFETRENWVEYTRYIEYLEKQEKDIINGRDKCLEALEDIQKSDSEGEETLKKLKTKISRLEGTGRAYKKDFRAIAEKEVLRGKEYELYHLHNLKLLETRETYIANQQTCASFRAEKTARRQLTHQLEQLNAKITESSKELCQYRGFAMRIAETVDCLDEKFWSVANLGDGPGEGRQDKLSDREKGIY